MSTTFQAGAPRQAFPNPGGKNYAAWPRQHKRDPVRNKFVTIVNSGTTHTDFDQRVYCVNSTDGTGSAWEDPVNTITVPTANRVYNCDGFDIHPTTGDYLVLTTAYDGSAFVGSQMRKSTDGGKTWANLGGVVNAAGGGTVIPAYCGEMFRTSAGQLMMLYTSASTGATQMVRMSDADPKSFNFLGVIPRTAVGDPANVLEAQFFESGGTIICIARRDLTGVYTLNMRPIFTLSTDLGLTWTDWAYCTPSATEMTNNNMEIISNGDGTVDCVWGSRRVQQDGFGSMWISRIPIAQLMTGDLGRPVRMFQAPPTKDFGYPGLAETADGSKRILLYYTGTPTATQIMQMDLYRVPDSTPPDQVPCRLRGITADTRT